MSPKDKEKGPLMCKNIISGGIGSSRPLQEVSCNYNKFVTGHDKATRVTATSAHNGVFDEKDEEKDQEKGLSAASSSSQSFVVLEPTLTSFPVNTTANPSPPAEDIEPVAMYKHNKERDGAAEKERARLLATGFDPMIAGDDADEVRGIGEDGLATARSDPTTEAGEWRKQIVFKGIGDFDYAMDQQDFDMRPFQGPRLVSSSRSRNGDIPFADGIIPLHVLPKTSGPVSLDDQMVFDGTRLPANTAAVKMVSSSAANDNNKPAPIFQEMPKKTIENLARYVDFDWDGTMPEVIIASRGTKMYQRFMDVFVQKNTFVLHEKNHWSVYGMDVVARSKIVNLQIVLCTSCNMTHGKEGSKWLRTSWYAPENSGLTGVKHIKVVTSHQIASLPSVTKLKALNSVTNCHYCLNGRACLERLPYTFPILVKPFQSLTKVTVHACFVPPGQNIEKLRERFINLKGAKIKMEEVLGIQANCAGMLPLRSNPAIKTVQRWTFEDKKGTGMNWTKVVEEGLPRGMQDFGDLVNTSNCAQQ
ncbi:hypothetical protein BJ875DRAFT_480025 [Amylocarpus encephaloides]|uniref:Uncharacterized protein n=1 Tax=Amylocarpus encephaloides TaxID=45428 RepID=A0A9P8C9F7_9HELO|nr:hypothetical protein BJ875DRAFT_480025 [Amylocarpus encephaloides]